MLHLWKVTGGETFWVIHPGPIPEMLKFLADEEGWDLDDVEGDAVRLMGRNETVTVREDGDLPATTKTAREWCNEATKPQILCATCY